MQYYRQFAGSYRQFDGSDGRAGTLTTRLLTNESSQKHRRIRGRVRQGLRLEKGTETRLGGPRGPKPSDGGSKQEPGGPKTPQRAENPSEGGSKKHTACRKEVCDSQNRRNQTPSEPSPKKRTAKRHSEHLERHSTHPNIHPPNNHPVNEHRRNDHPVKNNPRTSVAAAR